MDETRIDPPLPEVSSRPVRGEKDIQRIRRLLVDTLPITPVDWNWEIRRWDGWRYYREDPSWDAAWATTVRLWETAGGRLAGAAHTEGRGNACLQIHPDYRRVIEADMIAWAEAHLAGAQNEEGLCTLRTFVFDYDAPRRQLLSARDYAQTEWGGVTRRLRLGGRPLPSPQVAAGYTMRSTRPGSLEDSQAVADILNAAFRRDFHTAGEHAGFARHSPSFRHDLDLAAVAPDGTFAAYVGLTLDEANGRGIFEPVCTHPAHRRRGLARALMIEGLWRLRALGAVDVTVGTGDDVAANRFYDSLGFDEAYRGNVWEKHIPVNSARD